VNTTVSGEAAKCLNIREEGLLQNLMDGIKKKAVQNSFAIEIT
jgi:hypothetical protein